MSFSGILRVPGLALCQGGNVRWDGREAPSWSWNEHSHRWCPNGGISFILWKCNGIDCLLYYILDDSAYQHHLKYVQLKCVKEVKLVLVRDQNILVQRSSYSYRRWIDWSVTSLTFLSHQEKDLRLKIPTKSSKHGHYHEVLANTLYARPQKKSLIFSLISLVSL